MPELHSRFVKVGDLDLHYLECGEGPPVLLLHGWPTNAQLYRHVMPAIGETHRAIAVDLPGFGQSTKRLSDSYSFYFYDRALTGFAEALGLQELTLVVHDLGGPVGLHWMAGQQARVRRLVLLNTLVFPQVSWAVAVAVLASFTPGLRSLMSSPWGIKTAMKLGVQDKERITDEVAELYQAPFRRAEERRVLLKCIHSLHPKGMKTIEAAMAKLEIPVTCIFGEDDRALPDVARTMDKVAAMLPGTPVHRIPDCGHFLQEDKPEALTPLLLEALG